MKCEVLDHGYVEFIESWGTGKAGLVFEADMPVRRDTEVGIIEAARQSTQKGFVSWGPEDCTCPEGQMIPHAKDCASVQHPGDFKLLTYLYEHKHNTPFEFAGMVLEVQAPIFVFREWHRHRTQSYNEMSARYAPLPDLYYEPTVERVMMDGGRNKQAQGSKVVSYLEAVKFAESQSYHSLHNVYRLAEETYKRALADGIPKELARLVMPVGHYSRMRVSANLRNWLAFMTLRCDPNAQWEIRQYANAVADFIHRTFPLTYSLWQAEFADASENR